jgi:lipopolysaccharide/colanic/teichoic acid biosynthesis glycosyltransferase
MAALTTVVAAGFVVAKVDVGSLAALAVLFSVAFLTDCGLRYGYDVVSRKWVTAKHLKRRILVLGNKHEARAAAKALVIAKGRPVQPVGFASERRSDDRFCVGTYGELDVILRDLHIFELVIVQRHLSAKLKAELIEQAERKGIGVRYLVEDHELVLGATRRVDDYGLMYTPAALITPEALELKRITDTIVVTVTLPIWTLIIASYAAYSKLRRRGQPVIIVADRVGLGITAYSMLRLRTRHKHPDGSRGEFPSGRIEAWLERTGLDEIPQVFNVLRGEMSIVGPRAIDATEVADLSSTQKRTLGARPGITGRWQVAIGDIIDESQLRAMDADYLQHWRITHDLELMLRTPLAIRRRRFFVSDAQINDARAKPLHEGATSE